MNTRTTRPIVVHRATMVLTLMSRQLPKNRRTRPPRRTSQSRRMLPSKLTGVVLIWAGRPVRPTQAKVWGSAPTQRKAEKDGVCQDRTAIWPRAEAPERQCHGNSDSSAVRRRLASSDETDIV